MNAGKYAEACPKLAESQRLDPGGGTLLNLGLCHEKQGKIASAWSDFKEALSAARRDGRPERERGARDRIEELEKKLPWLTVAVEEPASDQTLLLDGAAVGRAAWGTPVAIDPGNHELRAVAKGRKTWSQNVTMAVAQKLRISVPKLEADPSAPAESANATPADSRPLLSATSEASSNVEAATAQGKTNTLAWVIGGVGVAGVGVGSFFGLRAISRLNKSDDECPTDTTCTPQGVTWNNEAKTAAWLSTVGFGVGLVGIATSAYLLLTRRSAEHAERTSISVAAAPLPGGGAVRIGGAF